MIQQILLALALASVTVVIHVVGTVRAVLPGAGIWNRRAGRVAIRGPVLTLTLLVSGLLLLHVVEMSVWALAFTAAGIFSNFETSLYYSLKSYTTVGYGDVLPPPAWRLLGPIEASVGILMLGISTSVTVAAVQQLHRDQERLRGDPPAT